MNNSRSSFDSIVAKLSRNAGSGWTRTKSCWLGRPTGTVVNSFLTPAVSTNEGSSRRLARSNGSAFASSGGFVTSIVLGHVFLPSLLIQNPASAPPDHPPPSCSSHASIGAHPHLAKPDGEGRVSPCHVCCALGAGGHAIGARRHHAKAKVVGHFRGGLRCTRDRAPGAHDSAPKFWGHLVQRAMSICCLTRVRAIAGLSIRCVHRPRATDRATAPRNLTAQRLNLRAVGQRADAGVTVHGRAPARGLGHC